MNKITIITILLALVAMAGQAQVKCHIRGELRDTTHGKTVVICPADVDIRVSDNYITTMADAKGQFSCDVEANKMGNILARGLRGEDVDKKLAEIFE